MSVQTDLATLVGPLVDSRVWPKGSAPAYTAPYLTYFRVVAIEESDLGENGGAGNAANTRLQVDVYAKTYADAQQTAAAVKAALKGWVVENILLAEMDGHEPDTGLHSVTLDISTWHY